MRENAEEFRRRSAWLEHMAGPRSDWARRGPLDVAFTLEALGATPDGFSRVLRLVDAMQPNYLPAGLTDVAAGYRIGVSLPGSTGGEPLGVYKGAVIVAWAVGLK